ARGDGALFRRLAAGEHDVVRQSAQFARRTRRTRHDRGVAEEIMTPALSPHLQRIVDAEYPRFSAAALERRRTAIPDLLAAHDVDHLVYCGFNRTGSAVQWLTQWPVTAEAVGVFSPGKPDALFVQYFNHLPLAQQLAERAEVAWGGESSIGAAIAE